MRPFVAPDSADDGAATRQFASDVEYYLTLTPRQLPSRYFYDALGSALFEAICQLPWYRVTRAERRLLALHGRAILARVHPLSTVVELGPGSGEKMAALIDAGRPRQEPLMLHLVDVSPAALDLAQRTLSALDDVEIVLHEATYEVGLTQIAAERQRAGHTLTLFLGSNIGNFDPPASAEFLAEIRRTLRPGDGLLLGADLVKPEKDLLLAYDDPIGVTAAFNKNLLARINTELLADFDLSGFDHRAVWNAGARRVEMHLVSRRAQRVRIRRADCEVAFEAGETIWTESSYKYDAGQVVALVEQHGFRCQEQWIESEARFALTLFLVA
jgi:dimethylhistidine N-methyltransferase